MIGENIKRLRIANGLTQKDLAEKLFVTAQAVSRWENCDVEPSATTIYEMAKIFNVSIDEIFGTEAPQKIEKEPIIQKEYVYKEPREILAVCAKCNKAIYDQNDIVRGNKGNSDIAICKACHQKILTEMYNKKNAEIKETYENAKNQRRKSFVWGGVISAIVLLIAIIVVSKVDLLAWAKAITIVGAVLVFPFVSCLFLKNNVVEDIMVTVVSWGFVKFPGIIFGLSLDGFIFFIAVKILFWVIGILIGCLFTVLAFAVGLIVSIFVYPFALYWSYKRPEKTEKSLIK